MPTTRLSALDASFLDVESPTAHMHVGWAAAFTPPSPDTGCSFEDLRDHIASRLGRAPRYRQRIAPVPLGVHEPVWVDDPDFDPHRHIRLAEATDLGEVDRRTAASGCRSRCQPRCRQHGAELLADAVCRGAAEALDFKDDACFGLYADRATLPDADRLAWHLDEAIDELLVLSSVREPARV
jgi:hypothetical protein